MLGGNPSSPVGTNLLYAGEWFDTQSQHYYLRARYYDPLNGRFNSVDPFAGSPQDPQSLHKYLYCHANPINGIDPSGRFISIPSIVVTIAIIAAVVGILYFAVYRPFMRPLYLMAGAQPMNPEVLMGAVSPDP